VTHLRHEQPEPLIFVCPHLGGTLPYICGRMDHQLHVLKRGPQNLQRKPSEYLRSIDMDIVSPTRTRFCTFPGAGIFITRRIAV
jgi:hypothetical protein